MSLRSALIQALRADGASALTGALGGGVVGSGALEGRFDPGGAASGALAGVGIGYGASRAAPHMRRLSGAIADGLAPRAAPPAAPYVSEPGEVFAAASEAVADVGARRAREEINLWRNNDELRESLRRRLVHERLRASEADILTGLDGAPRWNRHTMQSILDGELDGDTIMPSGDYLLGGAPDPAAVRRLLSKRGPKKPSTYDYREAHRLLSGGMSLREVARTLGVPEAQETNIRRRVERAIAEGELEPYTRQYARQAATGRRDYDLKDLVASATARDSNGYLPRPLAIAEDLRGGTDADVRVIRTQLSRLKKRIRDERAAGRLDDLAAQWNVSKESLEQLVSNEKAGFSIDKAADRIVAQYPDASGRAAAARLAKVLDAMNADYAEGTLWTKISQARRRAGLPRLDGAPRKRNDNSAASIILPYLVSGGGLSAIWSAAMASDEGRRAIMQELNSRDAA